MWLQAFHLLCTNEQGLSAIELHKVLGITYRSAWLMARRIRLAMTQEPLLSILHAAEQVEANICDLLPTSRVQSEAGDYLTNLTACYSLCVNPGYQIISLSVVSVPSACGITAGPRRREIEVKTTYHPHSPPNLTKRIALVSFWLSDRRLWHVLGEDVIWERAQDLEYATKYCRHIAGKIAMPETEDTNTEAGTCTFQLPPRTLDRKKERGRVTNTKAIPHIPLPFEQVMAILMQIRTATKTDG
jgi:hypothetical protein